jgi:hypothetical protein
MKRTAAKTSKATPAARAQKPGGAQSKSSAQTKGPALTTAQSEAPAKKVTTANGHVSNGAARDAEPAEQLIEKAIEKPLVLEELPVVDLGLEDAPPVLQLAEDLASGKPAAMANASRIIEEWLLKKPEVLVPAIDRLIGCISSPHKRVAQTAALALPIMGRIAPARVARHLPALTDKFPECTEIAKDGLVATFAALCTASVAYQKRLEPVLDLALSSAEPKTLLRWAEVILPSLKGEPHARARSVVEGRLPEMPRAQAQPIASFLGIKLRPLPV